ncbi:MAG: hypothetical protein FJX42_09340, partial [Alphaproteobacteria bacterium]|nr:hypothetical protein [Alphaproteobacteria bacterium]
MATGSGPSAIGKPGRSEKGSRNTVSTFIQVVFGGLAAGASYALLALAMVLIYKTSEVLNFAQGDLAMFAVFVAFSLMTGAGAPFALAVPLTVLFALAMAALAEFAVLRRAKEPNVLG